MCFSNVQCTLSSCRVLLRGRYFFLKHAAQGVQKQTALLGLGRLQELVQAQGDDSQGNAYHEELRGVGSPDRSNHGHLLLHSGAVRRGIGVQKAPPLSSSLSVLGPRNRTSLAFVTAMHHATTESGGNISDSSRGNANESYTREYQLSAAPIIRNRFGHEGDRNGFLVCEVS